MIETKLATIKYPVTAVKGSFFFRKRVLVLSGNISRTIVLPDRSKDPVIYPSGVRVKFQDESSVIAQTNASTGVLSEVLFENSSGNRTTPSGELSNLEEYPFCSTVWPALIYLSTQISHAAPNPSWPLENVVPLLVHKDLFKEYDQNEFSHSERVLLDAFRLGIGEKITPYADLDANRLRWISSLAASANNDHVKAVELSSSISELENPKVCVINARASANHGSSLSKESSETISTVGGLYRDILVGKDPEVNGIYSSITQLVSWYPEVTQKIDEGKTLFYDLEAAEAGRLEENSMFANTGLYKILAYTRQAFDSEYLPSTLLTNPAISSASLSFLDNLINRAKISEGDLKRICAQRPEDASYLWCRVSPETASKEHLIDEEFEYEIFRREFIKESSDSENKIKTVMEKLESGMVLTEKEFDLLPPDMKEIAKDICKLIVNGFDQSLIYLLEDATITERLSDKLPIDAGNADGSAFKSDSLGKKYLRNSFDYLLAAEWEEAIGQAREVLRLTDDESLRDEALNFVACGYWQIGEDQKSIGALETALEGEYNSALQINLGIVAQHLDPTSAIDHLVDLASEAPTSELQFQVIQRAFSIWYQSEIQEEIPKKLQGTAHKLLQEMYADKESNDENVWKLTSLLSSNEGTLPVIDTTDLSTLRENMLRIGQAQTEGLVEYIEAVGELRGSSDWVSERKDSVVSLVLNIQQVDIASAASGVLGMTLLETGIEIPLEKELRIQCFTIIGVCQSLMGEDGMPRQELIDQFVDSVKLLDQLEPAAREDAKELFRVASEELLRCLVVGAAPLIQQFYEIAQQLSYAPANRVRRSGNVVPIHREAKKLKRNIYTVKKTVKNFHGLNNLDLFDFSDELLKNLETVIRAMSRYV